jgi:hypothetical protein
MSPEPSASEDLRAPDDWTNLEDLDWKWTDIIMQEVVWSDLPAGADEAIEDFIRVDKCSGDGIARVHRLNPQTIEVVWYDDEEKDAGPTEVSGRYIRNVRHVIQEMFGEQWRVSRKEDQRRWNDEHPQRAIIRRADHQRFKYREESDDHYLLNLHGRPDNTPEGVDHVGQLDHYREYPVLFADDGDPRDVYVYETGTETVHLLPLVRDRVVAVDQQCECGLTVEPEEIVDGERIQHYADYLDDALTAPFDPEDEVVTYDGHPDPGQIIGDDLCGRCWKSYARTKKTAGRVRDHEAPTADYEALLPEVDHD